ncbi:hypothetical protein CVT26_012425 [Gymnopilus dilepis]|uniref:Uncharacterized protein n=1 Tax=Gymnopilus dilepis TaxID=231916 RepID=A0A409YCX4_9AGAR|nr:hypothetical protein CVT26_012425 [Gymnopilus dilepis]
MQTVAGAGPKLDELVTNSDANHYATSVAEPTEEAATRVIVGRAVLLAFPLSLTWSGAGPLVDLVKTETTSSARATVNAT